MSFEFINGVLHAEKLPLNKIAEQFGTPCYVYSKAAFTTQWRVLDQAFGNHPHTIYYAVKANSNLAILGLLAKLGSGFDIVSEGELKRVLRAGGKASQVVFSGVAKSEQELRFVIEQEISCINVESIAELERIQELAAQMGKSANIAIRVNPDVDAKTHPYIATGLENSKFGITMDDALGAYITAQSMSNINIHSITCHIGSQITELAPFIDAVAKVAELVNKLKDVGIELAQIDLGGGLGIQYQDESLPDVNDYAQALLGTLKSNNIDLPVSIEPGRYIAGNSGVLLTKVEYIKKNNSKGFAIVDAGMNDLLRPSLYQAFHEIVNIDSNAKLPELYDIVGPVCESSDVLGYERSISVQQGDLLAVMSAGAYGYSMASNYNTRSRPAEIIVDDSTAHLVRQRESFEDQIRGESLLP